MGLIDKDWSGVEGHRLHNGCIPSNLSFISGASIYAGGLTGLFQQERWIAKDWMLAYIHMAQVDSDPGCLLDEGSVVVDDGGEKGGGDWGERWNVIVFVLPYGFSEFHVISDHYLIRTCIGQKNCSFAA